MRVLVASDHPTRGALLACLAAARGCEVATAPDVGTSLDIALTEPPDCLLVDLADGSGTEVLRLLDLVRRSQRPALASCVVVVIAEGRRSVSLYDLTRSADALIGLPFHERDLVGEVQRLVALPAEERARLRDLRARRIAAQQSVVDLRSPLALSA